MKFETPEVWQKARKRIKKVLPEDDFDTWIAPLFYDYHNGSVVYLSAPHSSFKKFLEDHYLKTLMEGALSQTSGYPVTVNIYVREADDSPEIITISDSTNSLLNPKYTFERFIRGANNQFAYDAAVAVGSNLEKSFNPLYIYAKQGLGKTHLLNAIGHTIRNNAKNKKIFCCSAEKFMHEMVNHLRLKKMDQFRNQIRTVDVLLIDDIQFLSGKSGTQEEFLHTFNALYEANKQIVITSDRLPRKIKYIDKHLRSRLNWGLVVKIQPADLEAKIAILSNISENRKTPIPDEVIQYIASRDSSDIRELEGMIIQLDAYSSLQKRPITLEMIEENLKGILGD